MLLNNRFESLYGTTFVAADTHMSSQRRCVVKQLQPEIPNRQCYETALKKFKEEVETLEQLHHDPDPLWLL